MATQEISDSSFSSLHSKAKRLSVILALCYLALPNILFCLGWLTPIPALIVSCAIVFLVCLFFFDDRRGAFGFAGERDSSLASHLIPSLRLGKFLLAVLCTHSLLFADDISIGFGEVYSINSSLTVSRGSSLILNAGSSLQIANQKSLTIKGTLFAVDSVLSAISPSSLTSATLSCSASSSASFSECRISSIAVSVKSGASWVMDSSSIDASVVNCGSMSLRSSSISKNLTNKSSGELFIEDSSISALYLENGSLEMYGGEVCSQYGNHDGYSVYLTQADSDTPSSVLLDGVLVAFGLESAEKTSGNSLTVRGSVFGGDICNAWSSSWSGTSSCASVSSSGIMRLESGAVLSVGNTVTLSAKDASSLICGASVSDKTLGAVDANTVATLEHTIAEIDSASFSLSAISLSDSALIMSASHAVLTLSDTVLDTSSSICGERELPLEVMLKNVTLNLSDAKMLSADFSLYSDPSLFAPIYLFDLSSVFSNVLLSGNLLFDLSGVAFPQDAAGVPSTLLLDLGSLALTDSDFTWSAIGISLPDSQSISVLSGYSSLVPKPSLASLSLSSFAFLSFRRRRN